MKCRTVTLMVAMLIISLCFIGAAFGDNGTYIEMVLVEAGSFSMGSVVGRENEVPVHEVTISRSFFMSKFEVTNKQWREVMYGSSPSHFKGDDLPVETVRWYGAIKFCNRLSEKEGLTPCYSGTGDDIRCDFSTNGYRLPTEAEWEYAARGGNKSQGFTFSGSNSADDVAWYEDNDEGKSHPVGQKSPNELDLYDMSGNVWEWCWDWYGEYSSDSQIDPSGPPSGIYRVNRGGSWRYWEQALRPAYHDGDSPENKSDVLGFRIVKIAQ